ncbi:MAG TPA: VTT domain-containing protein [Pyrinomonadaceae bacterium]|jgi:membrane protein YqaA with SNARE-associated domain|nr:VTT domain-containing protein [Pyrinomonadaceae bacterium]
MFDWIREIAAWLQQGFASTVEWLEHFIISVPMYVAAPSMILIGALDSSLLSLPEINDYLVVMRCAKQPSAVFYFPLFAAVGSVIGCMLLYTIIRGGGQAIMRRRFRADHIERVERAYARWGFMALAVPALLPPPMPFKIFVATAGALEYPRWRFILTVMIARSVRYYIEGTLAVFYGENVLSWMKENGALFILIVAAVFLVGIVIYLIRNRRKPAVEKANEAAATSDV